MSAFSEYVQISISGFTQNVIYYDLQLTQKMADHHYFSFLWQYTGKPIIEPKDQEEAFSIYIGRELIFTFKVNGVRLMSKGKITRLDSIDLHGSPVGLHVTGTSHTISIDEMKKSRIFHEQNLQQIGLEVFSEEGSGEFYQRESIVPTYTKEFKFKTQYNETNFDFLKRLATRYGQWFYFDGMRMQFGKLKNSNVTLINESSLHNFRIEAHLVSHKTAFSGYNYLNAENIKNASAKTIEGSRDRFASMVGYKQANIAQHGLNNSSYTNNAQNSEEIDLMVKLQTSARDANSVFYSGTSYLPIGIGQMFSIENKNIKHDLVAVEVKHCSEVNGNYTCQFRAIPADVAAPHYTDVNVFASSESQPAVVIDNNDPEKLGRIKVQYFWGAWNSKSDWMRVVQPYSGSSKGLYFRPEIGEEVHVSFEGSNAERPYVSGTYYNGKEMPDFFDAENRIKGWKLRFGMLFKFIEKIGIWLSDPSGNELHMNEKTKSTTLTVPETATIRAKNIIFEATESITFTAGTNISEKAGIDKSTTIGMMHNVSVGGNSTLNVIGNFMEHIEGDFKSTTEKDRHDNSKQGLNHYTEGDLNKNAQKQIQNNSGEQTRQN
ncbi:phage baseplate assembly protein V [Flavobacterium sp.]|uniref:type VI secretion system Vgr family protein n=1 Tax=Flavobacterium sp. TaxID=239 RepID=UPI0031E482CB